MMSMMQAGITSVLRERRGLGRFHITADLAHIVRAEGWIGHAPHVLPFFRIRSCYHVVVRRALQQDKAVLQWLGCMYCEG